MKNYQNGKIYSLVCHTTGLKYIGSTIETLDRRLSKHISHHKRGYYLSNKEILDNDHFTINLLEDYPCNSSEELRIRERYYIENNECVNRTLAYTSLQEKRVQIMEWRKNNREHIIEYRKQWYNNNKMTCVCECGIEILEHNKKRHELTNRHISRLETMVEV